MLQPVRDEQSNLTTSCSCKASRGEVRDLSIIDFVLRAIHAKQSKHQRHNTYATLEASQVCACAWFLSCYYSLDSATRTSTVSPENDLISQTHFLDIGR